MENKELSPTFNCACVFLNACTKWYVYQLVQKKIINIFGCLNIIISSQIVGYKFLEYYLIYTKH